MCESNHPKLGIYSWLVFPFWVTSPHIQSPPLVAQGCKNWSLPTIIWKKWSSYVIKSLVNLRKPYWAALLGKVSGTMRVWSCLLNSLWPSDVILRQRSGSTLDQIMACCLMAPNYYLNQCWFLISELLWNSSESSLTANAKTTILCDEFENYDFKFFTISPRVQWVNWVFGSPRNVWKQEELIMSVHYLKKVCATLLSKQVAVFGECSEKIRPYFVPLVALNCLSDKKSRNWWLSTGFVIDSAWQALCHLINSSPLDRNGCHFSRQFQMHFHEWKVFYFNST